MRGKLPETLKELIEEFFVDDSRVICSNGAFTVSDFNNINKILKGEKGFFVIFDNAGGKKFQVWQIETGEKLLNFVTHDNFKGYVYGYRYNDKDTVIKHLPNW